MDLSVPVNQTTATSQAICKYPPTINVCGSCRRPLPRCYVCQLYIGMINPNLEFNRMMTERRKTLDAQHGTIDAPFESDHHVFDVGRWFFFCQRCKHGGHATCTDEWFASSSSRISNLPIKKARDQDISSDELTAVYSRGVCGVNGCRCECTLYGY